MLHQFISFGFNNQFNQFKKHAEMDGSRNFGLNIFQWNCNGLSAHLNEIKQHLSNNSYDVICLQETFLKPSKYLSIDGYSIIRKDRIDMRKGGLVTFIKDCLTYTEITPPDDMECFLVKIKTENSYITVANIYISPNQTIDRDKLSVIFLPKTIIVGDLNAKNNIWGSPANPIQSNPIQSNSIHVYSRQQGP